MNNTCSPGQERVQKHLTIEEKGGVPQTRIRLQLNGFAGSSLQRCRYVAGKRKKDDGKLLVSVGAMVCEEGTSR